MNMIVSEAPRKAVRSRRRARDGTGGFYCPVAALIASHTRSGVAGMSMWAIP